MTLHRPFKSVLIANRGEIACRIVREARAAGIRSIAVYSDADKMAMHVLTADAAIHIGPSPAADSYLSIPNILAAAKQSGAEAVHPGYGFLSENADFAQAAIDAGLVWIGPSPAAIRAMGDKGNAKETARKARVPVISGYDGDDQSNERLLAEARKLGWPVLIKAALGGGGRGQRKVIDEGAFMESLEGARREALSAFASDRMILEKALENVRHVEVQVFGDCHGKIIHLGERDCSVQRRNQKIIEEAPAPGISDALRNLMGAAAVSLAKAVEYTNAGTIEYLLDSEDNFWFLEMNTRIQVEHPVTEEVTGTNLIQWQFDVAAGKSLPLHQGDIRISGHAMEARLCLEDPGDNFKPQTGHGTFSLSTFSRCDTSFGWGVLASGHYDSMIAKVIAKGADREAARAALVKALSGYQNQIQYLRSNRSYLVDLLEDPEFRAGGIDIGWLGRRAPFGDDHLMGLNGRVAAFALAHGAGNGWRSTGSTRSVIRLREREKQATFVVEGTRVETTTLIDIAGDAQSCKVWVEHEGIRYTGDVHYAGTRIHVLVNNRDAIFDDITYVPAERKDAAGAGAIRAPMAGKIVKLMAEPGKAVARGDLLVILEAMKMEHELRAATDGTIDTISIKPGDQVAMRQLLISVKPA